MAFENAQIEHDMKPSKLTRAAVTTCLTHEEFCVWVISRFKLLFDTLDVIYVEKKMPKQRKPFTTA